MKYVAMIFLSLLAQSAFAGSLAIPFGKFDCSSKAVDLQVTLTDTGLSVPLLSVRLVNSDDQWNMEGFGVVVSRSKSKDNRDFNLIRLPGTRVELYFDEKGNLGLTEDALTCKRLP